MQAKQSKKKLPWWARLLIVLLVATIVFLGFSYGMIRYFVGDTLSFKGILSMVSYGGFDLPEGFRNFVLDVDRSYPGLPELLVNEAGDAVTTPEQYDAHREEMLSLYETYMYGVTPTDGFNTTFTVVESGIALNGKAERQQVRITISNEHGSSDAMLLIYTPANAENYGMFVGLNFSGNTAVWNDEVIIPSSSQDDVGERGIESGSWPVDLIIDSGYGIATMYYGDWAKDDAESYRDQVLTLFPEENCTAFSAWAFGIMRGIDYLEQLEQVDMDAIGTAGHSRLARVSLWAGACDERIDLVTASCGGGLVRSPLFAKIDTDGTSNHWFTAEYYAYEGRDEELPVDIHMLYALIADRNLYISIGQQDLASDPKATWDALQEAKPVWQNIYGIDVIPDGTYDDVIPDQPIFSEGVAVHVHSEGHQLTAEDWQNYIVYMNDFVCS
ncbi:MAG: hypothetical protein IJ001_08740 [Oscillospiraceae bacterium]|nr:hypothetical protein [Oscillospiraceae bacterium]